MDIAAMSNSVQNALLKQTISFAVQKMTMETQSQDLEAVKKLMESSVTPHLGANIDFKG